MTKLSWEFDDGGYVAWHNGYRITAKHDDCPPNPFEDWDGNWPLAVYHDRSWTFYDKSKGSSINCPLDRFSDEALVHDQIAIASALGTTIRQLAIDYIDDWHDREDVPNYITDAGALRDAFDREIDYNGLNDGRGAEELWAALYQILGIPFYSTTSRGYCQGDYAEVFILATPEAQQEIRGQTGLLGGHDAHVRAWWDKQLQGTADLYTAWAWGDVYGYVIEYAVYDEDGEIEDWVEIDHGSCWGFYGSEHDESGLEEAALDAVPDEPAPGAPVRLPDTEQEAA